jgi:hypothetical protein
MFKIYFQNSDWKNFGGLEEVEGFHVELDGSLDALLGGRRVVCYAHGVFPHQSKQSKLLQQM